MGYISALTTKNEVIVWERSPDGERLTKSYTPEYYFYVDDPDGTYTTIYDTPVSRITCKNAFDLKTKVAAFKQNDIRTWESDIPAEMRVLSNHYYNADVPKLNITFLDIEVDYDKTIGFSGIYNPYAPINSVSLLHYNTKQLLVFCVPPDNLWTNERLSTEVNRDVPIPSTYDTHIHICENECELLTLMLDAIKDSDIVCGWNSEFFDFPYIHRRIEISLGKASLRHLSFPKAATMNLQEKEVPRYGVDTKTLKLDVVGAGRLYADYMELYRKYEFGERSSYKLEAISDIVLVDADDNPILPKLHYKKTLYELYREDFAFFIRYNIRDVEILAGFEDVLSYVELSNQMYHRSTAQYQHVSGTLKLAEYAIINYCHHVAKRVVPDCEVPTVDAQISGALVLEPKIGVHDRFGAIDLNSLYPSGIRSINISPETIRGQFEEPLAAVHHIINAYTQQDDTSLTLRLENGERIEATASEWRVWLLEHHWSISGYGTVFDQAKQGIIPAVLADWYATRKSFQAKSKEAPTPAEHDYYDRLQYVYKIKLNSLYGALTNLYFRFYDLRMGESTTCTGRLILQHQCAKTNEVLTTKYDMHGDAVIYGDTDSTYFHTFADNNEDAIKIADYVAAQVNASYPEFMRNTFLCNSGFDHIIKAGREIVASRGIFVQKKRYILHVIDKEGTRVDTLKVMGLDTKKTNLPSGVGDTLNNFVARYLKGESWKSIAQSIVDYKNTLRYSQNIMDIGLPKGIKNVDKYSVIYRTQGKEARLPGHVAAAIHYNECLEKYQDKDSTPITSGMKIKVFYLKGNHGKFKSIAIPTDNQYPPPWFDNFEVDVEAHILRLVDNPLTNIIKAIGEQVPSQHTIQVQTAWEF